MPFMKFKSFIPLTLSLSALLTLNSLTIHAFPHEDKTLTGSDARKSMGSNYWVSSNLREWLNSDSKTVRYTQLPPDAKGVKAYPYADEAGFLTGFTEVEKNAIAITERGSLVGAEDKTATTNGKTSSVQNNHNDTISINFDFPNFLKNYAKYGQVVVNEKVFILNYKELAEYVQHRGWSIYKKPSTSAGKKYNKSASANLAYYVHNPVQDIGSEYLKIVSADEKKTSTTSYPNRAEGIAPALHLKPDASVKRLKAYNINSIDPSWTITNDTVKARQLNIGDIVEFGSHLGERIQWRVINISAEGYPLLFSENIIDLKAFDAKGDYSQRFSYLDLEDVFPNADVSMSNFHLTNIQKSTDISAPSIIVTNENDLFERQNGSFNISFKVSDPSGIAYIKYPDETKISLNNVKEYTFNYKVNQNGYYTFGVMDSKGNFKYFVIPVGNINLAPSVNVIPSTTSWTNQNVTVAISATNDVGWSANSVSLSTRSHYDDSWGNYTTYTGKRIRITGKVQYISDKNDFDPSKWTYAAGFKYKQFEKNGDDYILSYTWPYAFSDKLSNLKQETFNNQGFKEVDITYTIPNNYFSDLQSRLSVGVNVQQEGDFLIRWTDLKYELLDNDDFAITKIELPDGTYKTVKTYTDTISKEGINTLSYKVHDNRGMITTKTVTTKIDKTKPTLNVSETHAQSPGEIQLKIQANDTLSGVKQITLPNGSVVYGATANYTVPSSGSYTFKVADYAGNVLTKTVQVTGPTLTAQAKPTENMIRLDWTNVNNATYQVYQKKEGRDDFQTIGTMDFNATTVRVLNVYPYISKKTISFTSWDGSSHSLPQSAILKQWMEEPNAEHSKGYGKGLITVDAVSISDFNDNPDYYLKNGTSEYQYDVIVFGISDSWGDSEPALEAAAELAVDRFLTTGRGVLFGHDTAYRMRSGTLSRVESFTRLAEKYLDVQLNGLPASELVLDNFYNGNNPSLSVSYTGTSTVEITKKGFLTNFPWSIGEVGTLLTTPYTHTAFQQTGKGDIWMRFNWENKGMDHPMNSYLYTHNNTALVQTGHSIANKSNSSTIATPDEQKVLANTLFYLKQLSSVNFLDDYSGQDVKAPLSPRVTSTSINDDQSITITFDTFEDQGSTYDYYVKATHKNGNSSITSNTVTETITSGVAGVSYVVDTNPETIPDNTIDTFSNNKITLTPNSNQNTYLHIKVIDRAGNVSRTEHFSFSIPKINVAEQRDNSIYLNWDIEIPTHDIFMNETYDNFDLDIPNNILNNVHFGRNGMYLTHNGQPQPVDSPISNSVKIISGVGSGGSKGVLVNKTTPDQGWEYNWITSSGISTGPTDISTVHYNNFRKLSSGRPAIVRYLAKGSGTLTTSLTNGWTGTSREFEEGFTWAETLTATEFENRLKNHTPIKINNPSNKPKSDLQLATAKDETYSYNFRLSNGHVVNRSGQWYYEPYYYNANWQDATLKPGQVTTPGNNKTVESIFPGKPLYEIIHGPGVGTERQSINNSDWTNYSFNIDIPFNNDVLATGSYFRVSQIFSSDAKLYVDNLQIAYAPKSRLYRDGKPILEDYTVEHYDSDVRDKETPEAPIVSTTYQNGNLQLNWKAVTDRGTPYTYQVSTIAEDGSESLLSESKVVNFTSGLKEYRIYLNGSLIQTTNNLSHTFTQSIKTSDRIEVGAVDHAGNESRSTVNLLNLTAQAKPSENMIRLDWTALKDHTYQVYQKKEGADDFQSIGATNFDVNPSVRVLNVYPTLNTTPTETYTTWKGETVTLPLSASLKKWMEVPNSEHPKGYGKGVISVDAVLIDNFNSDPNAYLKDSTGNYKYDVIMFGSHDSNAQDDLNAASYEATKAFIESGNGVLFGHDTVTQWVVTYFPKLQEYINVKTYEFKGSPHEHSPDKIWTMPWSGGTEISITQKGILTNFPWEVGDIGTKLTVPYTHTNSQIAKGDIWMKFSNPTPDTQFNVPIDVNEYSDNGVGTNMAYLTSWNNTAMIQTGHSIGRYDVTADEQKLLANTLFYLNQLSSDTYLTDYSGQDVKAPNLPSVEETIGLDDGSILVTFNPFTDQGSTYDYYVKATHKNGNSSIVSNTATETITSGVAGVSYVVDTNPETIPDNQLDTLSNYQIKLTPNSEKTTYLHIKAIDHAGNASETLHLPIQNPPILRSEVVDNTYVRLDWAIDILPENVLWAVNFESNEQSDIDLVYYNKNGLGTGGQYFDNREYYSGNSSLYTPITVPDKGNNVWAVAPHNITTDRNHVWYYGSAIAIPNNTKISAAFRLKTAGAFDIRLFGKWLYENRFVYYDSYIQEDYPIGTKVLKVSNVEQFEYNNHITFDPDPAVHVQNTAIESVDVKNGTITLQDWIRVPVKKGDQLKQRPIAEMFTFPNVSGTGDNTWQLFNSNTTISNPVGIDWSKNPQYLRQEWIAHAGTYIDDLKVGYATKVKLYRDNRLIHEGYESFLNDVAATDQAAPDSIDLKTMVIDVQDQGSSKKFVITFNPTTDLGSTYTYQISSVNRYGMESLKSAPVSETVTSGVKGYSYLIDSNPTSEPDNTVDLTTDQTQISYTGQAGQYLHIKVIDHEGNSSETQHIKLESLTLTAQAKPSENMIRLDWTDLSDNFYQVYQKKEGRDDFQSISMTDLDTTHKVKVLNIYPINDHSSNQAIPMDTTFETWDGETLTLPKSARLKRWMEEPNAEHEKGYGQGLIEVTPIPIDQFNSNYSTILKNSDGSWKYDVIMIGTWDGRGNTNPTLNSNAVNLIGEFIDSGHGVLAGHDTIGYTQGSQSGLGIIREKFNIKVGNWKGNGTPDTNHNYFSAFTSTNVILKKKGLLSNYPWDLGEEGAVFTIPLTHTSTNFAYGDIWMDLHNASPYDDVDPQKPYTPEHLMPYSLFYLTTWNNTAMIQTGHSNGEATPDEQKILANTLFYLNQLSENNYLNDYSGQDVKAPNMPSVDKTNILSSGFIEITLKDFEDNGSTYEYYVKATHKGGSSQISNTVTETITTGVAGISYIVDTNPNTIPDNTIDTLNNQTLQIKPNTSQTTYLHVKTIDGAGNSSETLHYKLDSFTLTAQAKPSENNGKGLVRLDWTPLNEHTYQVYQKKEGDSEFQSISMTDLSEMDPVKVLNIYPTYDIPDREDSELDIAGKVAKKSAVLKDWISTYGLGMIQIESLNKEDFESDPDKWIKNPDGSYKYDVLAIGFWNIGHAPQHINSVGISAISDFISDGGGVLVGHQHIGYRGLNLGLNTIKEQFGVKLLQEIGGAESNSGNIDYIIPEQSPGSDESYYWTMSTQVVAAKSGLLLNYPHQVSQEGRIFNIPLSHDTWEFYMGDVWLQYHNPTSHIHPVFTYPAKDINKLPDGSVGTTNGYIHTFNNTAIAQTGHTSIDGQLSATEDEGKLLANTLFYLKQLSSKNYLNDYSGQDVKAPNRPTIKNHTYHQDNFISLSFDTVADQGSTYEYYVKATHKNGEGLALSNIASATVTSGIKGYSWMADSNPDTIPDDIIEQTTNSSIKIPTNNNGPYYLHIKAIDKAGNVSETHHYELTDTSKPSLTLTQNPTTWTNGDVIITASASDSGTVASGVKEIILPDGNKVSGSTATFTAIQNGTYTFTAVDFMGNQQSASITISNIDKVKPTGSIVIDKNQDEFYDEETEIHINMSDILDGQEKLSGIAKAEIFDVNGTYTYTMTNPTQYTQTLPWVLAPYELPDGTLKAQVGMKLTDRAGNVTTVYSKEVAVIKVRVEEFHLTDVVNPAVYNKNNPFNRLSYPNIPSQELVLGGSFEFEAIYSYPPTVTSSWTATYKATIYYIHPTEGTQSFPIELVRQSVDGVFKTRHTIPFSVKKGTQVYLDLGVKVFNTSGKLMGEDTFPDPAGTRLKIGEITGDIREQIQFNEIY